MTEFDTPEDEWARGVFDRVRTGSRPEPHWAPDAAGAAQTSARHRQRVRVTGALAAAAVIGVSATVFATLDGGSASGGTKLTPGSSPAPTHALPTSQDPPLSPEAEAAKVANYVSVFAFGAPDAGGAYRVPAAALTTVDGILTRVDPGLGHVRAQDTSLVALIGPEPGNRRADRVEAHGYWTTDGDSSRIIHTDKSSPLGAIDIRVSSPRSSKWPELRNAPCGLTEEGEWDPASAAMITWSACDTVDGPDGSRILTTHSVNFPAGQVTVAARVFPDGSTVTITATSFVVYLKEAEGVKTGIHTPDSSHLVAGKAVTPTPWTDDRFALALMASDIKALP